MSKQPYRESPFFRFFRMAKKQKQKQNVPSSPRTEKYFRFLPICNQSFWYAHADEGKWRGQIRLRSRLFQLGLFYQQNDPSVIRKKIKSIFQKKDAFFMLRTKSRQTRPFRFNHKGLQSFERAFEVQTNQYRLRRLAESLSAFAGLPPFCPHFDIDTKRLPQYFVQRT